MDTFFQAYSISIPLQSQAILHCINEGVVSSLDDPVKLYLTEHDYCTLLHNISGRAFQRSLLLSFKIR